MYASNLTTTNEENTTRVSAVEKNPLEVKDDIVQHSQSQKKTFEKTATSIDGQLYEIRLVTLLLLEGLSKKVDSFYLASNMKDADKLDDIVFKYKYSGVEKSKIIFLQAKHRDENKGKKTVKENEKDRVKIDNFLQAKHRDKNKDKEKNKVAINNLFPQQVSKADFVLEKYFASYLDIKKQFSEKVEHPIFGSKFEDIDCDVIIYTNAEPYFNINKGGIEELNEGIEEVSIDKDSILNLSEEGVSEDKSYYKIVLGKNRDLDEKADVLKRVSDSEGDIKEFLSKLKLFVGQHGQTKLGEIIKRKIQEVYKVAQQDIDSVFSDIESRVLTWWNKENYYLTKENHRFFQDALRISIEFDVKEPVVLFTGREKELDKLHESLQKGGEVVISQMASVTGLGGVGKSELAREYIKRRSKDYYDNNVIWINAENYRTIEESFRTLAQDKLRINTKDIDGKEKDIESIVPEVYKFFADRHRKSLFVFDNAGKYKTDKEMDEGIDKFLPSGSHKPHVLITSRNQEWKDIELLQLGVFTEEEAVKFIRKALGIEVGSQESEIKELAKTLQYLPLALTQAVAYIKMENKESRSWNREAFTIENYLSHYKAKAEELLNLKLGEEYGQYTETVFTTWTITIDKIKQKKMRGGEKALEMLNVMAYLAPDKIPIEGIFLKLISDEEELHSAIELLDQYSMANLNRGALDIHRLVQQVARIKLEKQNKEEDVVSKTFGLLKEGFPYGKGKDTLEDHAKKRQLLPHLEAFLLHMDDWVAEKPENKKTIEENYLKDLLVLMGDGYSDFSNPRRQRELLERALPIFENHYGPEHFQVAIILTNLGVAYGVLGGHKKYKELLEHALAIQENHYGHDHSEVAITLVNLGNAYGDLGDPKKQKELLERALAIQENHYGHDHSEVARTLGSLGTAYGDLGDHKKKKELLERALKIQEKYYGPEHFEVAKVLVNLGTAYGDLGDPKKQKELLERALVINENHYGPDHFEVATVLENLGTAYGDLGDPKKQKELLERALPILENHYGPDYFEVARVLENLGTAYGDLGDPKKQKELLERALPILENHCGPGHFKVAMLLANLGNAYGALGNPKKQKELLKRTLPIFENHYGPDYFEVARVLENLGNAYGDLGDPKKQKELLERALPVLKNHYGPEHFEVAKVLVNLGTAYGDLGDPKKQKELLEWALPILENHYGPENFEVAKVLENLGIAYWALGDPKHKELFERALKIEENHYGLDHFEVARTLVNLGIAYGDLGDHKKKKELLERALPILEEHYGADNRDTSIARREIEEAQRKIAQYALSQNLTPLQLAARNGHLEDVRTLIENGVDVNVYDNIGNRVPLHFASENGHLNIVNILLENGANIEAVDINDSTPLHYAAHNNRKEVVKALLENGANINAVDNHNKKPIDYTTSGSIKGILRSTKELLTAIIKNDLQKVRDLVQKDGVINAVYDGNRLTLLHYAADDSNIEIVKFLLDKRANINACDKDDWAPIHYAAQRGQRDIVQTLLSEGANIDARNNERQRPLDLARKYGNLDIVDLLSSSPLQIQSYEKQQKAFLQSSKFTSDHFPRIEIESVKQGLYLPSFEARNIQINGKCAAITRGFSQGLFFNQHKLLLNNLQTSAELYERIAQGKQISKREEREVFACSKLLDGFERQLDSATSSLPSDLIHTKGYKTLGDLSNYIVGIKGDFVIHLVTSNHVVAIYRNGDNYAYFDSNTAFVSGLKSVDQLTQIVEKAVKFAGYKVEEKGFLVEHFDVDKANSQLSNKDKKVLAKEIKTERQLLAEQDKKFGLIKINGQELSRVQLYDFGTKINVEGGVPLLINADMNLSSKKFQDHLDKKEVSMTAREYLGNLKNSKNVEEVTKVIPFIGSKREVEKAEQTRKPKFSLRRSIKHLATVFRNSGTTATIASTVSLANTSRSESQSPGTTDETNDRPESYLSGVTVNNQLKRSR